MKRQATGRLLLAGGVAALLATGPAAAQDWIARLPVAPRLPQGPEAPAPALPNYAVPDFAPDRQLLPNLKTRLVTARMGLEFIADYTAFGQDDASLAQVGRQADLFEVRSASADISGEVGLGLLLSYKVGVEYNGFDVDPDQTFAVTDFNVSFAIPAWRTKVSVGQMREDFSYEIIGSTSTMAQSERVMSPFAAPQNTGLKVAHLLGERDRMLLTYGIFKDDFGEGDGRPALSARLTRLMVDQPEQERFLHLGVALRRSETGGSSQYKAKPGVAAADNYVDTGEFPAEGATHLGLEAHWSGGPFSVLAEYAAAHVDAPASGDPVFRGWYVLGSWVLTGESRAYDRSKGVVKRIVPLGRWGAPELVVRLASVDLDDGPIRGGRYSRLEMGGNWWATTRWKFGMLYGRVRLDRFDELGVTHSLLTRIQWVY